MSPTVRPATIDDANTISGFQIAMALETEEKTLDPLIVKSAVAAVFEDKSRGFYLVGEIEGKVVGSLLVTYEWSDWRNSNMWYIQSVYVEQVNRGRGVFRKLYQRVMDLARNQNVMCVRLYVEVKNDKAQRIYESLGMKKMPYFMYDVKVE